MEHSRVKLWWSCFCPDISFKIKHQILPHLPISYHIGNLNIKQRFLLRLVVKTLVSPKRLAQFSYSSF